MASILRLCPINLNMYNHMISNHELQSQNHIISNHELPNRNVSNRNRHFKSGHVRSSSYDPCVTGPPASSQKVEVTAFLVTLRV